MINVNVLPPKQLAMLKFKLMPPFRGLEMGSSKTLHQPNTGGGGRSHTPCRCVWLVPYFGSRSLDTGPILADIGNFAVPLSTCVLI